MLGTEIAHGPGVELKPDRPVHGRVCCLYQGEAGFCAGRCLAGPQSRLRAGDAAAARLMAWTASQQRASSICVVSNGCYAGLVTLITAVLAVYLTEMRDPLQSIMIYANSFHPRLALFLSLPPPCMTSCSSSSSSLSSSFFFSVSSLVLLMVRPSASSLVAIQLPGRCLFHSTRNEPNR